MGYKYEWVEEPWILRVNYFARLTYDDLESVMEYCLKIVENHPANFLVDLTEVESLDPNAVKSRSAIRFTSHPNTKWLAVVGVSGSLTKLAVAILGRFTSLKHFNDIEAGLTFLRMMANHQKQELNQTESS